MKEIENILSSYEGGWENEGGMALPHVDEIQPEKVPTKELEKRIAEGMKVDTLSLFPVEVFKIQTDGIDNKKLSDIVYEKEKNETSGQKPNMGGWRSLGNLIDDKRFIKILENVDKGFQTVHETNNYIDEVEIIVESMWVNVNRPTNYNKSHIHAEVHWSFVYYIKVQEKSGDLVFVDPRIRRTMQTQALFKQDYYTLASAAIISITPDVGDLIIFPSYLEHFVEPNLSEEPRISISGNIIIINVGKPLSL